MNQNTEYEKFTQEIYQQLVNADVIKPTTVKHNVKLLGKSGQKHQIDVYWEYEIAGVTHKVAIECKNYTSQVEIGKVRDFFGVLFDLGDVDGIMVTKNGYQSGAKKFGDYYNINLKELRTPKVGEAIIAETELTINIKRRRTLFKIDAKWAEEHKIDLQGYKKQMDFLSMTNDNKWAHSEYIPLQLNNRIIIDSHEKRITTLDKLEKELPDKTNFPFDDAYLNTYHWGKIKINEVKYEYEEDKRIININIDGQEFVKAILKDAINGDIKMFGR